VPLSSSAEQICFRQLDHLVAAAIHDGLGRAICLVDNKITKKMNSAGTIYCSGTGLWRKADIEKFATTYCANSRQASFFSRKTQPPIVCFYQDALLV
jgi:hypothetical protein